MPVEAPKGFGRIWEHLKLGIRNKWPDQQRKMEAHSTALLNVFIEIASPFMVLDELSQAEGVSRTGYQTPPIPIWDGGGVDSVSGETAAELRSYYLIIVNTERYIDLSGVEDGQLGPENVTAGLFVKTPETRVPFPVVLLEGTKTKMGEVACTGSNPLGYGRGQRRSELKRIKIAQRTAADIKLYFGANPDIAKSHKRPVATVKDLRQEEVVIQVPQK